MRPGCLFTGAIKIIQYCEFKIIARILFSLNTLKDIFVTFKIRD